MAAVACRGGSGAESEGALRRGVGAITTVATPWVVEWERLAAGFYVVALCRSVSFRVKFSTGKARVKLWEGATGQWMRAS